MKSGRIVQLDTSTHQTVQELLPWLVVDKLRDDELAMVQEHLALCTQCQHDAAWQRQLRSAQPPERALPDMERALAKLRPQLDLQRRMPARHAPGRFWSALAQHHARWIGWTLAAQLAAIVCLAVAIGLAPSRSDFIAYHALGASAGAAGNVVVVFKPETTERELRRILQLSGARVVDGPTVTDAYVLKVSGPHLSHALKQLRAQPAVILAESLETGGAP